MARAPSCAWERTQAWWWRPSQRGPCPWTSPWASAAFPRGASWRSTGRSPPVRPPWPCTSWPRPRSAGGEVAFIDAEHALDPTYARALGVDIDSMLISQPDTGEQGLEICEALVRSGAIDVVVVDSVAALVPRAEIEGDMGGQPCRPAGPADEPGPAEAGRLHRQDQLHRHLHQPAAGKGGRGLRQP